MAPDDAGPRSNDPPDPGCAKAAPRTVGSQGEDRRDDIYGAHTARHRPGGARAGYREVGHGRACEFRQCARQLQTPKGELRQDRKGPSTTVQWRNSLSSPFLIASSAFFFFSPEPSPPSSLSRPSPEMARLSARPTKSA